MNGVFPDEIGVFKRNARAIWTSAGEKSLFFGWQWQRERSNDDDDANANFQFSTFNFPFVQSLGYAARHEAAIGDEGGDAAAGSALAAMGEGGVGAGTDVLMSGEVLGEGLLGTCTTERMGHDAIALEGEVGEHPIQLLRGLEGDALGLHILAGDAMAVLVPCLVPTSRRRVPRLPRATRLPFSRARTISRSMASHTASTSEGVALLA